MGLYQFFNIILATNFRINMEPEAEVQAHTHFQCCSCFLHAQGVVALLTECKNE